MPDERPSARPSGRTTLQQALQGAPFCLFLDVDGTLLEFAPVPDAVEVDDALRELLHEASQATGGALALVSGRSLGQLDQIFAPDRWPAAGLHGLERRDAAGAVHRRQGPGGGLERARPVLAALVAEHPELILEDKGGALALHYRRAPELEAKVTAEVERLRGELGSGYHVQPGSRVLELKPAGVSKADAIHAFMEEEPFLGRQPIFAGDDLTDLDGFAAVERHGGLSVSVGERVRAQLSLPDPAALRVFLAGLLESAGPPR
jgi:trehalose 6-phosphate phosphatase